MKRILSALAIVTVISACGGLYAAEEAYVTQDWPKGRVLVWAKPGVSGYTWNRIRIPGSSVMVWNNGLWTEYDSLGDYLAKKEGRTNTQPPDKNTDILLPDAPDGKPYVVSYAVMPRKRLDGLYAPQWTCRHVTVGKGAGLDGGNKRGVMWNTGVEIYGNVTVEDGGYIYGPHSFLGDGHTFIKLANSPEPLCVSWTLRKAKDASVTLVGKEFDLAEGIKIESGRLVVPPKCKIRFHVGHQARVAAKKLPEKDRISFQRPYYVSVLKDGALEMGAGSRIGRVLELDKRVGDFRIDGLLQIGRAGDKNDQPAVIELSISEGDSGFLAQPGGLYIRSNARVKNFGKLAITTHQKDAAAAAKKGISVFLENTVDLGDVSFDYLRPGGIAARTLQMGKGAVAKATFGEHCAAKGDKLFSTFDFIDFKGGAGTVEFVDGVKTDCKILFPHAGRLVVRGKGNRTLQSFDIKSIREIMIGGKRTEFNAKRPLNDKEKELRKKNALWGDVPGKGQYGKYARQEWPDCPVMIWARPGVSGLRFEGRNWLDETGAPYFETPLGAEGHTMTVYPVVDILLPAADTPYIAGGHCAGGNESSPPNRHLTVEYNATYGNTYNIQGNCWLKHGSGLIGQHRGNFLNDGRGLHRFVRFDGWRISRNGGSMIKDGLDYTIAQWGNFSSGEDGTLELIGRIRCAADRAGIGGRGTVIISEGSALSDGDRAVFGIGGTSTVALLQDAQLGFEGVMQAGGCTPIGVHGTLMIGMPDRPIRKDMVLRLAGLKTEQINRQAAGNWRAPGVSLMISEQGRLVIHSADPKKARLILKMHDSEKAKTRSKRWGTPDGLVCYFAGRTDLNGMVFDNILEGGIISTPAARAGWKNVSFGKRNATGTEKLYWDLKLDKKTEPAGRDAIMRASKASSESCGGWQEGAWRAFDGTAISRFRTRGGAAWIQYRFSGGRKKVETYAITSADDKSARDPKDWTLQGSKDGKKWDVLDKRTGEKFALRHQRRQFKAAKPGNYVYYRLDITKNNGADMLQVAEIEFLAANPGNRILTN
ncbi:MAG: discoidin domain-containing protein [Phycisphaerae bacterium]|jgi:hypothetical protein|nr:discoidin domain-containing protein [Phycisphaerae bacterium]